MEESYEKVSKIISCTCLEVGSLSGPVNVETNSAISRIEQQIVKMDSTLNLVQNEKAVLKNHIDKIKKAIIIDNREKMKESREGSLRLATEIQKLELRSSHCRIEFL
ncbi:hypothetical protein [Cytobacillus oceanisediminis]|uniref:hypothetical protein n=1 Tax=Cytobacillus oceanisediminis TaxID=665099 RepID=UPI0011A7A0E1|nr:hypothetical protein [Cytobacillus oceanisediminis]